MEAAESKGRSLPEWFIDEPPLLPGHEFYMRVFWDLNTTRQLGMMQGPIPYDKVVEYGIRTGLDDINVDALCSIIRLMDTAYMKWTADDVKRVGMSSGKK